MTEEVPTEDKAALLPDNVARLYRLPGYEEGIDTDPVRVGRAARPHLGRTVTDRARGGSMDTSEDTITGGRMVTRELAEWVAGLKFEDLPEAAVEEAGRSFADFLGEWLFVGATKPWGQSIAEFCARQGGGQPESTIIAPGKKTLSSRAALANGTMALGFEYADFTAEAVPIRSPSPHLSLWPSRAAARARSSPWPSSSGTR